VNSFHVVGSWSSVDLPSWSLELIRVEDRVGEELCGDCCWRLISWTPPSWRCVISSSPSSSATRLACHCIVLPGSPWSVSYMYSIRRFVSFVQPFIFSPMMIRDAGLLLIFRVPVDHVFYPCDVDFDWRWLFVLKDLPLDGEVKCNHCDEDVVECSRGPNLKSVIVFCGQSCCFVSPLEIFVVDSQSESIFTDSMDSGCSRRI